MIHNTMEYMYIHYSYITWKYDLHEEFRTVLIVGRLKFANSAVLVAEKATTFLYTLRLFAFVFDKL